MKNIFKRWFSSKTELTIDDTQNPWAGLASYEDPETAERKLKFCGRDDDSYDVARLIMGNVFVTLYGKSGIGKTSLLNAGIFPELREEQYIPLSLRLGIRDEVCPKSYQTIIVEAIQQKANRFETIHVIDEQTDLQAVDYLWNYFARHRFFDKYDEPVTPVIVLDQFEEVFRSDRKEAEVLLRQLDYLNDKDHSIDNCMVDGQHYHYEQNYRFVVSIREDDLYRLEDSIDNCYLPALKRCRYRLRSLSEQGARDVILIPGEGLFKKEEQDDIASRIIEKSRNVDGSISTNIISLLCSRIFIDFKRSGANYISPALVDSFLKGNPFERFYNEATRGLSNREKCYIEENLVDSAGHRNSIPENDFMLNAARGAVLFEGENRILQRICTSADGNNYRIELIHDSFCEPLMIMKEKRKRLRRMKWIGFSAIIVLICICATALFVNQSIELASKTQELEIRNQELEEIKTELEIKNMALKEKEKENDDFVDKLQNWPSYPWDGIEYTSPYPSDSTLFEWRTTYFEQCQEKIRDQESSLHLPEDMRQNHPCLAYLILNSRTMESNEEKQSWFDLYSLMSDEQLNKLYRILYSEKYKLLMIHYKDIIRMENSYAYHYAEKEDFENALETINKAISEALFLYSKVLDSKGEILLMQSDDNEEEALKIWKTIIETVPDFLDHYEDGTELYKKLKERGKVE